MKNDYRISLWNYHFYRQVASETLCARSSRPGSLERVIGSIRDAGYGVELFPGWFDTDNLYHPIYRKRLRMLTSDMASSLHGGGPATLEQHQLQIDTAAETESDVIVVHIDHMKLGGEEPDFTFAQEVLDLAHERGITIALETGPLSILQRALKNLRQLAICLDTGHVYHYRETMKAFVDALKYDICHLHVEDSLDGKTEHYVPGTGIISSEDWRYLFENLEEIDFNGAWVFEIRPRTPLQHAEQARRFLTEILRNKS